MANGKEFGEREEVRESANLADLILVESGISRVSEKVRRSRDSRDSSSPISSKEPEFGTPFAIELVVVDSVCKCGNSWKSSYGPYRLSRTREGVEHTRPIIASMVNSPENAMLPRTIRPIIESTLFCWKCWANSNTDSN